MSGDKHAECRATVQIQVFVDNNRGASDGIEIVLVCQGHHYWAAGSTAQEALEDPVFAGVQCPALTKWRVLL